ncbi:zinc finger protein 518B [Hyperolius riggenbachi]|uniref:zinc finger protein 518B n=1 Tax=Hyperolius riggenbachi TaxID=752182 RepID=UPI0035A3CD17
MIGIKSHFSFANSERSNAATNMMYSVPQTPILEKYNCEKCRFSTKDLNKFKIHAALHNEMKYVCSHCNFESYTKAEFQKHLVTHTGSFPFKCGYCGYGAIRNDYIMKHIKRIHGDGKIQCSVSTIENESKNASVNIVQTQTLPNNTTFASKNFIDLTSEVDSSTPNSNGHCLNGNGGSNALAEQVEVEVISPVDQQLYSWMPLKVVAPTSFKVPENCLVRVLEVKSVNSTCHLVLKCLEVTDSNLRNVDVSKENQSEQKMPEPMVPSQNGLGNSDGPCTKESTLLSGTESLLREQNTDTLTGNNANIDPSRPLINNGNVNTVRAVPNELPEEIEDFTDGPIISSVFSLSSHQTVFEGIQWDSSTPAIDTNAPKDTMMALNATESQCRSVDLGTEASKQVNMEKSNDQNTVQQTELPRLEAMKNTNPEIPLPLNKPLLSYGRKAESPMSTLAQSNKGGERKTNRLSEMETDLFVKPQTLFLSCDKRIVMQPLSCVMQTGQRVGMNAENEYVPPKVRIQSAKTKSKFLSKRFANPKLQTLRLYPAKSNQLIEMPCKDQPVVVLNHPEMDTKEIYSIMNAISMFKGKVLRVTLPKHMRKRLIRK